MKANKLFTRKKDSKMNRKGVLIAEQQRSNSKEETEAEIEVLAAGTDGK
jgi:hypothetical protein